MPELPEVETVVRTIRPAIVGRTIHAVRAGRKKLRLPWQAKWTPLLIGREIAAVSRRGKWIIVELDAGRLLIHLGMTGQLLVMPARAAAQPHTHLFFDLGGDRHLRYRDERRFGSIQFFSQPDELTRFLNDRLGPEPFDLEIKSWRQSLQATRRPIKAALLDQSVVAGVGNIYADEALHVARIHPATPAEKLDSRQARRLRSALAEVLTFAIERRGSSIRNYLDGAGERGAYQNEFRVYGRYRKPCQKCETPIERIRLAGRSTHFCPRCQRAALD